MKSKITKIQNILMKGIAIIVSAMMTITPVSYAATSLNDNGDFNLSIIDQILYGKVGATAKEIEKYFAEGHTTLYISSEVQLRALAEYVNSGHSCEGKEIILTKNIELSKEEWNPIGKAVEMTTETTENTNTGSSSTVIQSEPDGEGAIVNESLEDNSELGEYVPDGEEEEENFQIDIHTDEDEVIAKELLNCSEEKIVTSVSFEGTFDGNGHTISNLCYSKNNKTYEELKNIGLFGVTGKKSTIKNLTTDNFNINIPWEDKDLYLKEQTDQSYSHRYYYVGNIVGYNEGKLENCINNSDIYGMYGVGGIVGFSSGDIKNCINHGLINGYSVIGGVVGRLENALIENCINTAEITGKRVTGGIVGFALKQAELNNCRNKGNIKGEYLVGGVIAQAKNLNISSANNYGSVNGDEYIGGIVGSATESTITKVLNNGENSKVIFSTKNYTGGIAGYLNETVLNRAINKMPVRGYEAVGGILGCANKSNIYYVYNMDSITTDNNVGTTGFDVIGVQHVGGLAGALSASSLRRSGTTAEVLGVKKCLGGAVGSIKAGTNYTNEIYGVNKIAVLGGTRLDVEHWKFNSESEGTYNNSKNPVVQTLTGTSTCMAVASVVGYVATTEGTKTQIGNNYVFGNVVGMQYTGSEVGYINSENGIAEIYGVIRDERYTYISSKVKTTSDEREFEIQLKGKDENGTNIATASYNVYQTNQPTKHNKSDAEALKYGLIYTDLIVGKNANKNTSSKVDTSFYLKSELGNKYQDKLFAEPYEDDTVEKGIYGAEYVKAPNSNDCYYDFKAQLTMQDTSNNVVMPIVNPDDELEKPVIGSTVDEETIGKATEKNVEGSVSNYSINYKLYKNNTEINTETYLKKDDKLKVTATINAPIVNVIDISNNITKLTSETAPTLSLKNGNTVIATIAPKTVSNVTTSSTETTFTYEYDITEETTSHEKINKVLLNKVGTLYVVGTTSQIADSSFGEAETSDLLFDNQAPDVITNMYVEQPLETGRYTAGKEILIKVTTNERIYGNYVLPELRVRFSKSGIGKYISSKDANIGYAKVKSAEIKIDGTTEWIYSYIAQEGDEGNAVVEYTKGTIIDRAGNTTYLQDKYAVSSSTTEYKGTNQFGKDVVINNIGFYKDANCTQEINLNRYQVGDIYVKVELDDALYTGIREVINNENAPKLYFNGNLGTEVVSVKDGNTIVYKYDKTSVSNITLIDYVTLKNEGVKLYYGQSTIAEGQGINVNSIYQIDVDNIYLDPNNAYNNLNGNGIYADTTLPTVDITAYKVDSLPTGNTAVNGEKIENDITNADIIRYRFRFSENVIGFTEDDVTVNFGTKSTVGLKKVNDKIYDLYVETNVEKGNTKDVQVIVEQDAVQDLVYQGNVRRENTVTVDKKAPILENYSVKQENGKIIVEATYDETISKTIENPLEIKFGDTAGFGGNVETEISENKVIYTYTISGSDNGKASIKLVDKVTDIVGNTSDPINAVIENDITVVKNVIRIGNDEYGFSFTDFSNRHYYKEGDVVTVIKDGVTYKHTVSGVYADNTHMKYMKLTEPGDGQGNVGNAEFSATQKANYINIEAANIYFDTTAPTLTVEADVEDKKDGSYTTGDEIIIKATASELLQESNEKPEINVSFSVSGLGKYNYQGENATTGNAKYVETVTTDNKTQYIYKYVVQNGDEGKVSLTYASANRTITDIAGNTTQLKGFTDQPVSGEVELEKDDSNITYRLYKGNTIIDRFGTNTIFKAGDIIKVEAEIGSALYNTISTDGNINVSAIRVPKLNIKIDNSDSNKITIDNSAPDNNANKIETSVTNNGENGKTIVTYIYTIKSTDKDGKLTSLEFVSRGNMYISSTERLSTFRNLNLQNANLYIFKNTSTTFESGNITVDTNAPIVTITNNADKNPTNQDPITYTFKWNEEVEGFTADDIEVNGGTIEEFNTVENKKEYTAKVKTSVAGGDVSELNVAVKQNAVRDIAGFENAREENSITIDKKAPTAEITADKENIDEIINYTINWSESVNGFETEDITVTNGTVKEFKKVENSEDKIYTLKVKSTNRNDLEVVIKENACTDNAGNTNMSAKHLINVRPTVIITALPREYDFDLDGDVDIEDVTYLQIYVEGNRSVLSQDVQEKIALFGDIDCDGKIAKSDYVELQKIIAELNNSRPINTNEVIYLFTWSEKVENFNANNIIVNGGTKGTLSEPIFNNEYGTYTYIMRVTNNIPTGSVGEIKVSVEQDSVRDVLGNGNIRAENIFVVDKKAPTAEITADKDYVKKDDTITYTINWSEDVKGFIENSLKVTNGQITEFTKESANKYIVKVKSTTGNDITFEIKENVCKDYAENANRECKHRIAVIPTVGITTNTTNPTKENEITYTFTWSENVNGFDSDDVIVPEGAVKSDWTKVNDTKYTLKVNYNSVISNGNQGEVTVAVKENAVQDNDGNGNAYTNNTLKIDRIAPILVSIEAYGTSTIEVDPNVDTVKQYYKAGDTVTVIATFSENIEESTAPTLNLQFSESGNAKGNVMTIVPFSGNKIRYIYEIVDEDNGTLSVKGFSGTVKDTAGNETIVTKRALDGETIIADTKAPTLVSLTAIAPEFEYSNLVNGEPNDSIRYGVQSKNRENNTITIIAQYSENVYNLNGSTIKKVTSSNAPTLKLKFGNSTERTATFQKVEGDKLYYTYNIATGDNGNLSITTISGTVSDLAGNTYKTNTNTSLPGLIEYIGNTKLEGNDHIVADTTKSTYDVSVIEKIDKDDEGKTITGNKVGNVEYFRMGSTIKIEVTSTNEYVYNNTNKELDCYNDVKIPENIALKFGTNSSKGQLEYKGTKYENNKTIFTFEYTVGDMDNGKLTVIVPKNFGYDIALNGNDLKSVTFDNIVADTERPYIAENTDRTSKFEITSTTTSITATGIFSEQLYVKDANNHLSKLTSSSDAPTMGVIANGKLVKTATASVSTENGMTKLVYTASTVSPEVIDGDISVNIIDGTLYDVAGNEWSLDIKSDTTSPKFSEIQVLTEDGYYNKDKTLDFVVKFVEQTKLTDVPKLTIRIGSGEDAKLIELKGTVIEDDQLNTSLVKVARYSYTIVDENGPLTIVSLKGTASDGVRPSNINEEYTTSNDKIRDYKNNKYINTQEAKVIVDTIAPTAVITSDVERTNKNKVTYTITWSEPVYNFTISDVNVVNGIKGTFTKVNDKVYILEVHTANEGRQIISIPTNTCEDIAGNKNTERAVYNKVVIDYTKPEVRAKVNGGKYVIDIDKKKSILKETIVVTEELAEFKYAWSTLKQTPSTGWISLNASDIGINSDIPINYEADSAATYYLHIEVTDLAGNKYTGVTNGFIVSNDLITITPNVETITNNDVIATISYGTGTTGLTKNRKAGVQGKTQSADPTKVILTENGVVYAEATDINGNKVYATLAVTNIDKTVPVIEATLGNKAITVTSKDTDIAKYIVTTTADVPEVSAEGWQNWGETNTKTVETDGTYYVWAIDKAGNISKAQVIVVDTTAPTANISYVTNDDGTVTATITLSDGRVTNNEGKTTYVFTKNGEFTFEFVDEVGNKGTAVARVTTIPEKEEPQPEPTPAPEDTKAPVIDVVVEGKNIKVVSNDTDIDKYIITVTTDTPSIFNPKWQESNEFNVEYNGTYYVWAKDKNEKISEYKKVIIDQRLNIDVRQNGKTIKKYEDEDLKYIVVSPTVTASELYENIIVNNGERSKLKINETVANNNEKLKTHSEVLYDNRLIYVIVVKGDVNGDGNVDFINDINTINNYRLGRLAIYAKTQILASDINGDGNVDFINDIIAINNYRLGRTNSL